MKVIVLAAGKGSRLHSEQHTYPKVLREANGRALLEYVLEELSFVPQEDTTIVVGYKKELVIEHIKGAYEFATQAEQLGTGHAVKMAEGLLKDYKGPVMVVYGDMPLYKKQTYEEMAKLHEAQGAVCTLLTAVVDDPPAYGRIIRDSQGDIIKIVEAKDCTPEEIKINELNAGLYVFDHDFLFENLNKLKNNNIQHEYYLTDLPQMAIEQHLKVSSYTLNNSVEIYGVNTPEELAFCEEELKKREV